MTDVPECLPSVTRATSAAPLPPFARNEFETIIRRQRTKDPSGLKIANIPSRDLKLDNQWEFAGWGSQSYLGVPAENIAAIQHRMSEKLPAVGQLRGTSLPGNSMTSSVFYAFPAVVAVSSIFSPLSLLIACLILFLWKPIFLELGSAIRLNGANYTYLLQASGAFLGFVGAAMTLLDSVVTSTESAATAASYLKGEFSSALGVSEIVLTVALLTGLAILCLVNIRRSSTMTLAFFLIHLFTMTLLMVASLISWGRHGSATLISNWTLRPRGTRSVAKAVFNGICVGFLGVTGFETTPTYIEAIHKNAYKPVLRNILFCTLLLNAPLILMVYTILPEDSIKNETNILSILAEAVGGRWLRILVVVDCLLVLAGGVMDGLCAGCALLERLTKDHVLPQVLLKTLPLTSSQYLLIGICFLLNIFLYSCSGFSLARISAVFTVTFLLTLMLFVLSTLLLKLNRDRLPRNPRSSLRAIFFTFSIAVMLLIGNIILDPVIMGLFVAYFLVTFLPLQAMLAKDVVARTMLWAYNDSNLQDCHWTKGWDAKLIKTIKRGRRHPVCVWISRDNIHELLNFILYIQENEITARIIFVHAYGLRELIPPELAPNVKILDEAFPKITLDLLYVEGTYGPALVEAVSARLNIPRSKMFMACPGENHGWELEAYQGVRILTPDSG